MTITLIGNIISLIGAIIMVCTGLIKKKQHVLAAQCAQFTFMGVGNFVLGGITGTISNIVSIIRNIVCVKYDFSLPLKLVFIVVQVILSAVFNQSGLLGWLPVIAAGVYTWFLDTKSDITLKIVILLTTVLWVVYDFSLKNFTSMTFDILTIGANIVGLYMIINNKKTESEI